MQDNPLLSFIPLCQEYVDEYLRHEGRGSPGCYDICPGCAADSPTIRCKDCFDVRLWCEGCAVDCHRRLPLHRIEVCTLAIRPRSLLIRLCSAGTRHFSRRPPSENWAYEFSWGTPLVNVAPSKWFLKNPSPSCTRTASISWLSTSAIARQLSNTAYNACAIPGGRQVQKSLGVPPHLPS